MGKTKLVLPKKIRISRRDLNFQTNYIKPAINDQIPKKNLKNKESIHTLKVSIKFEV